VKIQNRKEAAMPQKNVGQKTEVRVMIVPGSSALGAYLPDWTETGDLITKKDIIQNIFPLEFSVEPSISHPLQTSVFVALAASDFEIEQATKILHVSPNHNSEVVTFFDSTHTSKVWTSRR
jgi:hypothetical protein